MNNPDLIIKIITAVTLVLSGTIAGYITNKFAVRWLFKPVSFMGIKLFDVSLLSTDEKQEAFIESLSDCVERRVLTREVLRDELINDRIKLQIDKITSHFISSGLPSGFKGTSAGTVTGFEDTKAELRVYAEKLLDDNTEKILSIILNEMKVSEYLTDEQISIAVDSVYDKLRHSVKNNFAVKDRFSSFIRELLMKAMFSSEGRSALMKLASKLFKGGGTPADMENISLPDTISHTVKNLIVSALSNAVKRKPVADYVSDELMKELSSRLQSELLKKYDELIAQYSEKDMSELISLFADEKKLSASVSNLIFDYLDKNINRLLDGKIRDTVSLALGRLDPDQLLSVAERLMRGELRYLSYFGAVVGFVLSIPALLITLGTFSASGFPESPAVLIFLVLLMGCIGVLTNVIAIAMFFRPYKKIGFLARSKHTRVFSQGLILQNQKVFAHTLGEYIGTELMTSENILKLLEVNRDAFTGKLETGLAAYISAYLSGENTSKLFSARISAFLFNKMHENSGTLAERLALNVCDREIISIFNINIPENREKVRGLYDRLIAKFAAPPEDSLIDATSDSDDFRYIAQTVCMLLEENPSMKDNLWSFLETFWQTEIENRSLGDIFSSYDLAKSLKFTVQRLSGSGSAFETFRTTVQDCISGLAKEPGKIISPDFTAEIASTAAQSVYSTSVECLPDLLKEVHFAQITEANVASLEPEEIQNVVLSFASAAFRKLYALGAVGCVFGLNTYLAFLILIIDKLTERK